MDMISAFLMGDFMGKSTWLWMCFFTLVAFLMWLDLGVLHRKQKEIGIKESLKFSAFYISVACLYGVWVWFNFGPQSGAEYFTGYFIELTLSMDNLFVMSLIFMYMGIPRIYQHRVLFWGILGVIFLRGVMIGAGVLLIAEFDWILLIFAAFLLFTGIKMLLTADGEVMDMEDNKILKFLKRYIPVTNKIEGHQFFVREPDPKNPGRMMLMATPLFLALCLIELSDVLFAVDSIPAIFAITTDPFIIFTSNIFAVMGLRSMFFALSAMLHRFHYLKYSLGIILSMIGGKLIYGQLTGHHVDSTLTLAATAILLIGGILYSMHKTRGAPPVVAFKDDV